MLRSPETTPLRRGAAHGPLHPALCSSPRLQSFLFWPCLPLVGSCLFGSWFIFWGRNAYVLGWVPLRFWPLNCTVSVSSLSPLLPPPLGWGASSRRPSVFDDYDQDDRRQERRVLCWCFCCFFVFRLFGGLWPPQRLELDELTLPRLSHLLCSYIKAWLPPSPYPPLPPSPFLLFIFLVFLGLAVLSSSCLSYFVVLSFLARCVRLCLCSLFALCLFCPFPPV